MTDEKRKYRRISVNAIVIYQILDHIKIIQKRLKKIGVPVSVNISIGGLQIITRQKLPEGVDIKIELSILPTKIPLEAYGKVVWTKKDVKPGQYRSGIKFTKFINEKQMSLIEKYIDEKE